MRGQGTRVKGQQGSSERSSFTQTKELLRRLNLRAIKGLGQHFLIDRGVLKRIISAAELVPGDMVVEVGPGLGILTEELVKRVRKVVAIEVDSRLASALAQSFSHIPQLTIVNADVLELDPEELIMTQAADPGHVPNYKVVANLPYYIAAPVLRHFLEASLKPSRIVVMVQKEVGQSIVATPGRMSLLGVSIQLYGKPALVGYVAARSFYPRPKVNSAIVRIDVYRETAVKVEDIAGFFAVVRAGFSAPRKQLRNALAQGLKLPAASAVELLHRARIAPERRPQTISVEEWARIYRESVQTRE